MHWISSSLLVALFLTGAGAPSPDPGVPPGMEAAGVVAPAPEAWAGTVEGVLRIRPRPQRRVVNRYGGASPAVEVQGIPPVVFLKGRAGPVPAPATGTVMAQQDTAFVPPLLVVPVGTAVTFPNEDTFFHNVFSYSASARFDLGRYPRGESKDVTFDEPGIVKVYCEVHESMRAAIVVVENAFWAQPGEDGRFRFEGVPEGTYTLVAWHADRGEAEREVVVPASGAIQVEIEL